MATRLYIDPTAIPYTPATIRGAWDATGSPSTGKLTLAPTGSNTAITKSEVVSTNNYDILFGRWVSDGLLSAKTIAGTIAFAIRCQEANADANAFIHLHIYVTQGDSDTPRGTLLSDYIGANEFSTTNGGISASGISLSSVAAQAGDRIVIEIGAQLQNTHTTARNILISYGGTATTDLAGTNTTAARPKWIEFSENLPFVSKLSSLTDDFDDNSLDGAKFSNWGGGNVTEANQRLEVVGDTVSGNYYGIDTLNLHDMTDDASTIQLVDPGANHANRVVQFLQAQTSNGDNSAYWEYNNGQLSCWTNVLGSYTQRGINLAYPGANYYFRIREESGTLYWDYSADGVNWTNHASTTTPFHMTAALTSVFLIGNEGIPASASHAYGDNFNVLPSAPPAVNKGLMFSVF